MDKEGVINARDLPLAKFAHSFGLFDGKIVEPLCRQFSAAEKPLLNKFKVGSSY
ncbi:hypothetical protein LEP1GSC047_2318 [Leptospira inadai serovar Lyme str. 10]|uniref:Uncharacterized protein n=1 Tax=Leptospira inadai serovar Lyme str. 10 TaxID=1049790 RepID=V6HED5_9LEPT|nr:hypothetical protein LEP1GSC047_2318 [Leptospira inadai serovar Lyme str. 10]